MWEALVPGVFLPRFGAARVDPEDTGVCVPQVCFVFGEEALVVGGAYQPCALPPPPVSSRTPLLLLSRKVVLLRV